MQKIPILFVRDPDSHQLIPKLTLGCEWVIKDKCLMTIKIDGVCVRVTLNGDKWGIEKRMSADAYMKTNEDDPMDALLWKAFKAQEVKSIGIYEVYGEGIKGNNHRITGTHMIKVVPVDYTLVISRTEFPRDKWITAEDLFNSLKKELQDSPEIEGFVFHLEGDGMALKAAAKIRKKDFGIPWPAPTEIIKLTDKDIPAVKVPQFEWYD